MSLNVPASRHQELIRNWVSECQSGNGSHVICQHSRAAHQTLRTARQLGCVIELMTDGASGEMLFRLQNLEANDPASLDVPYATVSHHYSSSQQRLPLAAELRDDLSNWHTVAHLPSWLQQAAKAASASSVSHLWEPTLCSQNHGDGDREGTAEIYAGAVFNIACLADQTADQDISVEPSSREQDQEKDAIPIVGPSWAAQHPLALYQSNMFREAVVSSPLWTASSFHQGLLLAPATLFVVDEGQRQQRLWWHCADGALYSDAIATGVPVGDSTNDASSSDESESPQVCMLGTHTVDIQALLAQFFHPNVPTAQRYFSPAERLAALWTSVAMAYSQIEVDGEKDETAEKRSAILQDTAVLVRRLTLNSTTIGNDSNDDKKSTAMSIYAHGTWSGGLVYQLAWHGDALRQEQLPRRPRRGLPSWSWLSFQGPIIFEFLLSSGAAGLMAPYLDPTRPHVVPAATAAFEPNDGDNDSGSPPTRIQASGKLLEASMDVYDETGGLELVGSSGHAAVYFDCEDEEDRVLKSPGQVQGQVAGGYVVWPLFTQVDDAWRVESRGLVLREVLTGQALDSPELPMFVRCGWFQYSSADQEQTEGGPQKDLLELVRGDVSMHKKFLLV